MKKIIWSCMSVAVALAPAVLGGRAVPAQRHTTMGDTAMQDSNWAELMKSMQTMHTAMGAAKPSGNDDADFVNLMLPHHQAAVDMARAELLHGTDAQMRRLAQEIITDQESEIQLMQRWSGRQRTQSKERQTPDSHKE
jgi:uncharacterized protein (DUF305 family)